MAKRNLTKEVLDAIPVPAKVTEIRDEKERGLLIRIQPKTGNKLWYFEYRHDRKKTRIALGRYPEMNVGRARDEATRKRSELVEGNDPGSSRRALRESISLRDFIVEHYKPWAEVNKKSGAKSAERIISAFEPLLDRRVESLTMADFNKHRKWRLTNTRKMSRTKKPPTQKTINTDFRTLHAALVWGVDDKKLNSNPLLGFKPGQELKQHEYDLHIRPLEKEEEQAIIAVLDAERAAAPLPDDIRFVSHFYPLFLLSLDTGIRRNEALTLEWGDVNLTKGRIQIRAEIAKNGKLRKIKLTPRALEAIRAWRAQSTSETLVFAGRGTYHNSIHEQWRRICKKAGVAGVRWHDLRHTFATRLVDRGANLVHVQRLMGHHSLRITEIYLHANDKGLDDTIGLLG